MCDRSIEYALINFIYWANECSVSLAAIARCIQTLILMSEVKQCRARSVLGWETAWEHWVLLSLCNETLSCAFSPYLCN